MTVTLIGRRFLKSSAIVASFIVFLAYGPVPPYTNFSEKITFAPNRPLEGKLALVDKLKTAELWHKGDLVGPETFTQYNGDLYTSLFTGEVVNIKENGEIKTIVNTGQPCKGDFEERICGRSMGIKFDEKGTLFVADAYYGIFKVDTKTGTKELLISPDLPIEGRKPKVFNSLSLAKNGDIYWSDSSTEFTFEDIVFDMLADPTGRLIHYNSTSKESSVLIDKLSFANGVLLSKEEDTVIISETGRNRIHRYYLKGPKKGTSDIFIDGLPGTPDNIQSDGQGGYLVALYMAVDDDNPSILQILADKPFVRKVCAKAMGLGKYVFEIMNRIYPMEFAQRVIHFVGHCRSAFIINPSRATVLRISKDGEILESLHNLNKHITVLSEAYIFKESLYLGSPFNDYIGRIPLIDVGWEHLIQDNQDYENEHIEDSNVGVYHLDP